MIKKIRGRKGVAEKIILSSFRNRLENFVARISFPPVIQLQDGFKGAIFCAFTEFLNRVFRF